MKFDGSPLIKILQHLSQIIIGMMQDWIFHLLLLIGLTNPKSIQTIRSNNYQQAFPLNSMQWIANVKVIGIG